MPKRKGSARTEKANAARRKGARDEEGEEPVLETNEPIAARLDDVPDSAERFDVAGFGDTLAVTTYLTGALIGKRVSINKSVWAGYSSGYTTCEIVGYVEELAWLSGAAPALILLAEVGCGSLHASTHEGYSVVLCSGVEYSV